jgi:hypothetical protein
MSTAAVIIAGIIDLDPKELLFKIIPIETNKRRNIKKR